MTGRFVRVSPAGRHVSFRLVALAALVVLSPSCAPDLDTERGPRVTGTVGEEMFGVICDRVGAQALREDLSGASFRDVCHKPHGGAFADEVDRSKLPPILPGAVDEAGRPVSVETQTEHRAKAVGRIEALARRRTELIRAFDATFPERKIAIKDLDHPDETKSCDAPQKSGEGLLTEQVADMLGRMGELYTDGTLPQSTQSLARVIETFERSADAQAAWARLSSRQGYRPIETALGVARPVVAYPHLRDLANASLRLLSADADPYALAPKRDEHGARIPVPGPGNAALDKLLEAARAELLNAAADPRAPALVMKRDPATGRAVISRPRDNLEILHEVMITTDDAFGGGSPRFIVRRDSRGYAAVAAKSAAFFVDADEDGLPDVDDSGRFRTTTGVLAPSPFPFSGTTDDATRDELGRALADGALLYDYVDTSRTFAARLLADLKPLVNPDPAAKHETLMDLAGGLYVSVGPRVSTQKVYPSGAVAYEGIPADSPLLDLIHAAGALLGDRSAESLLALVHDLLATRQSEIARLTGALIHALDIAKTHDEAKIPRETAFWDDVLEITGKIAREPGLLEDILAALADPATAKLGLVLSKEANFKDVITYDKHDINGPTWNATTNSKGEMTTPVDRAAPRTGKNRSALMRVLQLLSDATGVTACNKADARLHAKKTLLGVEVDIIMPLSVPPGSGSYPECGVFKIDDLATFYLDAIVDAGAVRPGDPTDKIRPGAIYVRNDSLRNGLVGDLGAATVETMEQSSRLHGFWTPGDSKILAAKPEWLNRLVFFDFAGDDVNLQTKKHADGLTGPHMGSSVCPERVIDDPVPNAPDAAPDKKVRGLRSCRDGDWFQQRNDRTLFVLEQFGFYDAIRPLLRAFVKHKKEALFLDLAKAAYKVYPDASASEAECQLGLSAKCTRQGMGSYEALLVEQLATDLVPALSELARALGAMTLERCDQLDKSGTCVAGATKKVTGIDVAAAATRATLDPEYAKNTLQLTDRRGNAGTKRNDGSPVAQVTPAYLITNALNAIDLAYDAYEQQHPEEKDRRASFRRARSQLVDQFLAVEGTTSSSKFQNPTMPKMGPIIVDLLRSQLAARCPRSFSAPYEKCTWARDELARKAEETLTGPLASTALEIVEVVRRDPEARRQLELLLQYLLDAASKNDALASLLASSNDLTQMLRDEENLVPLYHVLSSAFGASVHDENGRVVQKSLVDAQMALLARVSGRYFDREGREICKREIDPNQVLALALGNLVTPIHDGDFKGQSPLEVIMDVIADVNRVDPTLPYDGTLARDDYKSVSDNVVDFLTNKERGLEQLYEVIRQGTRF